MKKSTPSNHESNLLLTERPFEIGYTKPRHNFDGRWWCNQVDGATSGAISNERLMRMSDSELEALAYRNGVIQTEKYRRPSDKATADAQGGRAGEVYDGVHRAFLILEFRKHQRAEQRRG